MIRLATSRTPLGASFSRASKLLQNTSLPSCRTMSISTLRQNSLAARALKDDASKRNTVNIQRRNISGKPDVGLSDIKALSKSGPTGAVPIVRGDWVLFHPVYTLEELKAVEVIHRDAKTVGDKIAVFLVKFARRSFDIVSRYRHKPVPVGSNMTIDELRKGGYTLDESQWLMRILFLETIAGVPGMVAATLRHLSSLRLMKRDYGWIHTLLEEAENERMHLMTFMTLKDPSPFFRALILGAQGVFYNLFFLCYLISPNTCHRFVGYLEEEAVLTYTRCIEDIETGRFPEWRTRPAPEIAIDYWRLDSGATMLDVVYMVRSDETTHRFVNHSLANLNVKTDVNPFALRTPEVHILGKKVGFERDEAEEYVQESHHILEERRFETKK